jgi:hypothetical protein
MYVRALQQQLRRYKMAEAQKVEQGDREPGEAIPNEEDVISGGPHGTTIGREDPADETGGDAAGKGGGTNEAGETVDLTIGGQTFKVPRDAAAALEGEQARFREEQDALSGQAPSPGEPTPAWGEAPSGGPDYSDLIFSDTNAAVAAIREDVKKEVLETVRTEHKAADRLKTFWDGFYTANSELKSYDSTVRAVMNENWADLRGLSSRNAAGKLADMTKTYITSLVKDFGGKAKPNNTETLEGGSRRTATPRTSSTEEDTTPSSLSAGIRQRRKAQRQSKRAA